MTNGEHLPKTWSQWKFASGLFTKLSKIIVVCDFSPSFIELKEISYLLLQNKYSILWCTFYIKLKKTFRKNAVTIYLWLPIATTFRVMGIKCIISKVLPVINKETFFFVLSGVQPVEGRKRKRLLPKNKMSYFTQFGIICTI